MNFAFLMIVRKLLSKFWMKQAVPAFKTAVKALKAAVKWWKKASPLQRSRAINWGQVVVILLLIGFIFLTRSCGQPGPGPGGPADPGKGPTGGPHVYPEDRSDNKAGIPPKKLRLIPMVGAAFALGDQVRPAFGLRQKVVGPWGIDSTTDFKTYLGAGIDWNPGPVRRLESFVLSANYAIVRKHQDDPIFRVLLMLKTGS